MNNRRLIAIDLDNTILARYFSLDPDSAVAMIEAQRAGHITMIATARPHAMAIPYHLAMGFHGPISTLNGAYAYHPEDDSFPVREALVSAETTAAFSDIAHETGVKRIWLELNREAHAVADPAPDFFYFHEIFRQSGVTYHDRLPHIPAARIYACADTKEQADAILNVLNTRPDAALRAYVSRTGEYRINCNAVTADKWYAVKHAADFYGIPNENIITFGDESNDRLMLLSAGQGFVLSNGNETLKAELLEKGQSVTEYPFNQGGIAHELKKLLS